MDWFSKIDELGSKSHTVTDESSHPKAMREKSGDMLTDVLDEELSVILYKQVEGNGVGPFW